MLLRNICCLNGEIKIIDFGLSTIFGKTIDDVLKDLYNNLNTLNKNISITPNIQSYIYINEYPNWRQNLENYKIKEIQLALIKKQLMAEEFQYSLQLAQAQIGRDKQKEQFIEDRKDKRIEKEGTQQSELIQQRQTEGMPKNFESSGNDVMGGFGDLSSFGPS